MEGVSFWERCEVLQRSPFDSLCRYAVSPKEGNIDLGRGTTPVGLFGR